MIEGDAAIVDRHEDEVSELTRRTSEIQELVNELIAENNDLKEHLSSALFLIKSQQEKKAENDTLLKSILRAQKPLTSPLWQRVALTLIVIACLVAIVVFCHKQVLEIYHRIAFL